MNILLKPGERGLLVGQTGSGKTQHAVWQAKSTGQKPVVIMDTKLEPAFGDLSGPDESMEPVASIKELEKLLKLRGATAPEYILVRPALTELASPALLDDYLTSIYTYGAGAFVVIDEGYQVHEGGRAGAGLIGLLTRGRSRGITTLVCTQRPVWLSRFCLTECQKFYIYKLAHKDDIRHLANVIPNLREPIDKPYSFWYYNGCRLLPFAPIPIITDRGYIPEAEGRRWF